MNRTQAIEAIKSAAAQGDLKTATQIFCNHRVSRAAYEDAVQAGRNFAAYVAANQARIAREAA